jgi:hypothetical protein
MAIEGRLYKPLKVKHTGPYGIAESLDAMRLPKGSKGDSWSGSKGYGIGPRDTKLAKGLIIAGDDHAKAMRGIDVHIKLWLQVGFMLEFETYRWHIECLSTSSTMHNELKLLQGPELAEQKQALLPDKVYVRRVKASYQALRRMYRARRNHRHPDWQIFCDWIETLPHFDKLIMPEL